MEKIAEAIYRLIEKVDGERSRFKLLPYHIAEVIKLYALRWIK